MRKQVRLTAHRIHSSERIMQAFHGAPVVITTQVPDGTIGECVHSDGLREVIFIPLQETGQHYRAMQVIRQIRKTEEESV